MKLYFAKMAPNPDRVRFFAQEKGVWDKLETIELNIIQQEHKTDAFRAISPLTQLPTLVLKDNTPITESRAICTYLEGLYPEPNLMGVDAKEKAVIEMWDRRIELSYLMPLAHWFRNSHPAMAELEAPQSAEWAQISSGRARKMAVFIDARLATSRASGSRSPTSRSMLHLALERSSSSSRGRTCRTSPPGAPAWRSGQDCEAKG